MDTGKNRQLKFALAILSRFNSPINILCLHVTRMFDWQLQDEYKI